MLSRTGRPLLLVAAMILMMGRTLSAQDEVKEGVISIVKETWNKVDDPPGYSGYVEYLGELKNTSGKNLSLAMRWVFRDKDNKLLKVEVFVGNPVYAIIPYPFRATIEKSILKETKRVDVIIELWNPEPSLAFYIPFPDSTFESAPAALSPKQTLRGDLDEDGDVDFDDFFIFAQNFGKKLSNSK